MVPGLTILGHADPGRIGERCALRTLLSSSQPIALSRAEPDFTQPHDEVETPLADPYLSRGPLYLASTRGGGVEVRCDETRTTVVANGTPLTGIGEFSAEELARGIVLLLADRVTLLLHLLDPLPEPDLPHFGLVGESAPMVHLRQEIQQVADLDVPVLLQGDTGTGKELAAQAIHSAGPRRERPYVAVNMGAIPPSLAASELFGAAKGAFTGATHRRVGYFNRANGGTLFLDEVGETPADVQPLLLRALEAGEIQPVGAELPQSIDVRILAATDARLDAEIEAGRFREPLYHRLSGYVIAIPPLRQRRDDFGRLLVHFLRQELEAMGEAHRLSHKAPEEKPWLPADLVAWLAQLDWPGNVRQLKNVVRQLVIASRGRDQLQVTPQIEAMLQRQDELRRSSSRFVDATATSPPATPPSPPTRSPKTVYRSPAEVSEAELKEALRSHRWRLKPTAAQLGISRPSLYVLLEKFPSIRTAGSLQQDEIRASQERCAGSLEAMVEDLEVSLDGLKRRMKELGLLD